VAQQPTPSVGLRAAVLVTTGIAVAQVSTYALNLVGARRLGPEGFGELASLLGIVAIGNVVALGLQAVAARRIVTSPLPDRDTVGGAMLRSAIPAAIAVTLATCLVWPLASSLLHLTGPVDVLLVALTLAPLTVTGAELGIAQGHEEPRTLAAAYLLGGLAKSLGGIAGALAGGTVTSTLVGLAVGSLLGALALRVLVDHQVASGRQRLEGVRGEVLHASHALLALFILTNADLLLARHFLTASQAGIYAAGSVVAKVAFWLPQAVTVLAFPGMADARRRRSMLVGGAAVLGLGAVLVLGTALLPRLVVAVVGGSAYDDLAPVVWAFALLGATQALAQFLLYSRLAVEDRRAVAAVWLSVAALVAVVWLGPHDSPRAIVLDAVGVVALLCVAGALLARTELTADGAPPLS
jgi:O-antigen/teichoic acid export membrane protein